MFLLLCHVYVNKLEAISSSCKGVPPSHILHLTPQFNECNKC